MRTALILAAATTLSAPAAAVPKRASQPQHETVAQHIAETTKICTTPATRQVVASQFVAALHDDFPVLEQRLEPNAAVVVSEASTASMQGYPNGFVLKNGRVWRGTCLGNIAMKIRGKIVEYRGLLYVFAKNDSSNAYDVAIERPTSNASYLDHLYIENRSLIPGRNDPAFTQKPIAEIEEEQAMRMAGVIGEAQFDPSPELRMHWRIRRLTEILDGDAAAGQ